MASSLAVRFGRLCRRFAEDKLVQVLQDRQRSRVATDRLEASLQIFVLVKSPIAVVIETYGQAKEAIASSLVPPWARRPFDRHFVATSPRWNIHTGRMSSETGRSSPDQVVALVVAADNADNATSRQRLQTAGCKIAQ